MMMMMMEKPATSAEQFYGDVSSPRKPVDDEQMAHVKLEKKKMAKRELINSHLRRKRNVGVARCFACPKSGLTTSKFWLLSLSVFKFYIRLETDYRAPIYSGKN